MALRGEQSHSFWFPLLESFLSHIARHDLLEQVCPTPVFTISCRALGFFAAVIPFNRKPTVAVACHRRFFATACMAYFDDFITVGSSSTGGMDGQALYRTLGGFGSPPKPEKAVELSPSRLSGGSAPTILLGHMQEAINARRRREIRLVTSDPALSMSSPIGGLPSLPAGSQSPSGNCAVFPRIRALQVGPPVRTPRTPERF